MGSYERNLGCMSVFLQVYPARLGRAHIEELHSRSCAPVMPAPYMYAPRIKSPLTRPDESSLADMATWLLAPVRGKGELKNVKSRVGKGCRAGAYILAPGESLFQTASQWMGQLLRQDFETSAMGEGQVGGWTSIVVKCGEERGAGCRAWRDPETVERLGLASDERVAFVDHTVDNNPRLDLF